MLVLKMYTSSIATIIWDRGIPGFSPPTTGGGGGGGGGGANKIHDFILYSCVSGRLTLQNYYTHTVHVGLGQHCLVSIALQYKPIVKILMTIK